MTDFTISQKKFTEKCHFDLNNVSQTFQRHIYKCLNGMKTFLSAYIDDILIYFKTAQHEIHLKQVISELKKYELIINTDKCKLSKDAVEFLGFQFQRRVSSLSMNEYKLSESYQHQETQKPYGDS